MRLVAALFIVLIALMPACTGNAAPGTPVPTPTSTATPEPPLPTPTFTPVPLPSTAQLSAPSRDVVWALVAGRLLFVSSDRGDAWDLRSLPPGAGTSGASGQIAFANERDGWLIELGTPEPQCASQALRLWRTTDGAHTWGEVPASGIRESQCKGSSLSFVDSDRGFLTASGGGITSVVYRTTDGGPTWTASASLTEPRGSSTNYDAVRAFGPSLLLPVRVLGRSASVLGSPDGGATWARVADRGSQRARARLTRRWRAVGPRRGHTHD
jgi:photosystem II stability/assembly factor-like uncharacterized protein